MIALRETVRAKDIPMQPFSDLLRAFRQDQRVHHYPSWDSVSYTHLDVYKRQRFASRYESGIHGPGTSEHSARAGPGRAQAAILAGVDPAWEEQPHRSAIAGAFSGFLRCRAGRSRSAI